MATKGETQLPPDLSVSIVSLRRPDLVAQCLRSIRSFTNSISYEVHLVAHSYENDLLDKLRNEFSDVVIHRVDGISGYSRSNNVALKAARGRYVVILNDDTVLVSDLFGDMVRLLDENPDIVGACPVLRNPDGSLQMAIRGKFTPLAFLAEQLRLDRLLPKTWAIRLGAFDRPWLPQNIRDPIDVETGTGACFVARRSTLESIGYLDETYFLAPDDIDWSTRLRQRGRVVLVPTISLIHFASTTLKRSYFAVVPAVYTGCYVFFRRYYGRAWEWTLRVLLGCCWSLFLSLAWTAISWINGSPRATIMRRTRWNCVRFAFSNATSTEVFRRLATPM